MVVQELVRSGHVQEDADGSMFCKFEAEAEPITADVLLLRLFAERTLRTAVPRPTARDLLEMRLPPSESPAAAGGAARAAPAAFRDLGLSGALARSLRARGLRDPSEIQ